LSKNPNNTYRYAGRNAYIKNLFNELNESGLNVVWTSKAKPLWVNDKKIPGEYQPDVHDDIPYMVDVNVQMRAVPNAAPVPGVRYEGVIGTNAFKPIATGLVIPDLTWDMLTNILLARSDGQSDSAWSEPESGESAGHGQSAGKSPPAGTPLHTNLTPSPSGETSDPISASRSVRALRGEVRHG